MASGKLSPRQKMINMMYLVLTALLALNISKEIILAFVQINESLMVSQASTDAKNADTYSEFVKAMIQDPIKTKPYKDHVDKVKGVTEEIVKKLEKLKDELIRKTDKLEGVAKLPELRDVKGVDNYDECTHIMCGSENDGKGHEASKLKKDLEDYKAAIIAELNTLGAEEKAKNHDIDGEVKQIIDNLNRALDTKDPKVVMDGKRTWEMATFYHNPLAAEIAILSKFENDVKNKQSEISNFLLQSITKADFKFDTLAARVVAASNYVQIGTDYEADVFVAAFSKTQNPEVWLGDYDTITNKFRGAIDSTSVKADQGIGKYKVHPSGEGPQKWGGVIRVKNPAVGTYKEYPFHAEYIAAAPGLVVSPDKMNVFYIGVPNPVSISCPGIPADNVVASITAGTCTGTRGKYEVMVSDPGEVTISVSAKIGNENKQMGTKKFRVKRIPPASAQINGKEGGNISKSDLAIQYGIIAALKDFEFEAKFTVTNYKLSYVVNGFTSEKQGPGSGEFTSEMKSVFSKLKAGDKIYFEDIRIRGPDGKDQPASNSTIGFKII